MTTTVTLHPDIAEYIGDGSAHAEQMPAYLCAILSEIADARRYDDPDDLATTYRAGLTTAYRAVLHCRFELQPAALTIGVTLVDGWTGDDLAHFDSFADGLTQLAAANNETVRVFTERLDADVARW